MGSILLIAIIIIVGYLTGKVCRRLKLPRVLGYLIAGVLLGSSVSRILQPEFLEKSEFLVDITLGIVGFIIGNELRFSVFRRMGKGIITIILMESLGAFILVTLAVYFLTFRMDIALVLGAIAPASAPAGTLAVLHEYKAKGPLTSALQAVVGLDDGFGIMIFAFVISIVRVIFFGHEDASLVVTIVMPLIRIVGAIVLGLCLGILLSYFAKKLRTKEELLIVSFAGILLCTGLSNFFNLSLILANLALGMTVANTALFTSRRISNVVEVITPPIYIVFFVLAGAHLNIGLLPKMGLIGFIYILSRSGGLIGGSFLGAVFSRAPRIIRNYLGLGILSQAGVAIGLSLLVGRTFGSFGIRGEEITILIINTIAATTIFFELIGPITTKFAISRAGEVGKRRR
jgi:Kef-type K+ transport system membrane component KefB